MDKQFKIRMINLTLSALASASLTAPSEATDAAIAYWQAALNRTVGK